MVKRSHQLWRRDRDSNPGDGLPPTRVPGVRLQPLGHLPFSPLKLCLQELQPLQLGYRR